MHTFSEVSIEKVRQLTGPVQAVTLHLILYLTCVHHEFQELEGDTLACGLGTNKHSQVSELKVGFPNLAQILDA